MIFSFGATTATLLVVILFCLPAVAEMREWTDSQGRKVSAEYVSVEAGMVKMKLANGKIASVPFAQLSEADQAWVKDRHANPPAPEPEPVIEAPKPTPEPAPAPSKKWEPREPVWTGLNDAGMKLPDLPPLPEPGPDTLIPVNDWVGEKYFYMRPDGSDAFPHLKFRGRLNVFSDDLAYVQTVDGKKGYINRKGEWVLGGDGGKPLPEGGDGYTDFSEGRARFVLNRRFHFIDTEGKIIGDVGGYGGAEDFCDGLAAVNTGETLGQQQSWSFINRDGKTVIAGPWPAVRSFSSGVAWVALDKPVHHVGLEGRKRLINTKGEPVFGEAVFTSSVSGFMGGYASLDGRVYRADGSVYLEEQQDYYLTSFPADGQIAVAHTRGDCIGSARLVHLPTKTVYGPKFSCFITRAFKDGIVPVHAAGDVGPNKWFCLDRTGHFVSKEGFFEEPVFSDGFAVCRKQFGEAVPEIRVVVINRKAEIIWKGEARK